MKLVYDAIEILKNNEESYKIYIDKEKEAQNLDKDLKKYEDINNKYQELLKRILNGKTKVEERNQNLKKQNDDIINVKKELENENKKLVELKKSLEEEQIKNSNNEEKKDSNQIVEVLKKINRD